MKKTQSTTTEVASEFDKRWDYPYCIGALDGKHVAIKKPQHSGSEYYNYTKLFSIQLLAMVDANYRYLNLDGPKVLNFRFIFVDVGATGRCGDSGIFSNSQLKKRLEQGSLNLPEAEELVVGQVAHSVSYDVIGDEAFPLTKTLMKPYANRNMSYDRRIFNYRLSRARRVVESTFGILANRFRVFQSKIQMQPDDVTNVILAAVCLHNFLIEHQSAFYTNNVSVSGADGDRGFYRFSDNTGEELKNIG